MSKSCEKLVSEYVRFMDITWWAAIGITALRWILYTPSSSGMCNIFLLPKEIRD